MSTVPAGHLERFTLSSQRLGANLVGASPDRAVDVYLPAAGGAGCPLLVDLVGFTGSGLSHTRWKAFGENVPARLDRLIATGEMPPVVVAFPDCFTRLGGNQYIDSVATGRWATFLTRELVPAVEQAFACGGAGRRGVFGKSSGGYGAVVLAMLYPEVFTAFADHSGDANFELCYLSDAPTALDQFRAAGGPRAWLDSFWQKREGRRSTAAVKTLNFLAMAAHYSPNVESPHMGIDFPFDLDTGRFCPEVWARWQAWDPVRMVTANLPALRRMRGIYVDCGSADEFSLHWGARALSAELAQHDIAHVYEEFADGHMNITYRFDRSIPFLAHALGGAIEEPR